MTPCRWHFLLVLPGHHGLAVHLNRRARSFRRGHQGRLAAHVPLPLEEAFHPGHVPWLPSLVVHCGLGVVAGKPITVVLDQCSLFR